MWMIPMAWKNIWRNKGRTMITMSSIFFAVILSVLASSLQDGIFDNLVKNVVGFYTGYVQVHRDGYWDEQILDNSLTASAGTEKKIMEDVNVSGLTPRLESFALASSGEVTKGCLVSGIDPEKENKVTFLRNKLVKGSYLKNNDHAVLLTQGLAERLKLAVSDTLILIGQGYHGSMAAGKYLVKGILKFGSPDLNDKALFMPLAAAQDLYGADGLITSYVLSLHNPIQMQSSAANLRAVLGKAYEVMTWEQMIPDIKQHIESDTNNMKYIQGILYLLICFGIFGTLLMMMVERRAEMGMLVAIGMKKALLSSLLSIESIITVLSGCMLGILASIPLIFYLNKYPLRMAGETAKAYQRFGFEPIFPASTSSANFVEQGLIVLVMGLLLSLYPVYKVIRLDPVKAMKR